MGFSRGKSEYYRVMAQKAGESSFIEFFAKKNGFLNGQKYRDYLAQRKGFTSHSERTLFKYYEKDKNETPEETRQRIWDGNFHKKGLIFTSEKAYKNESYRKPLSSNSEEIPQEIIRKSLNVLSEKEQRILESKTFREIGKNIGITGARVKQIEKKALTKMRRYLRRRSYETSD